MLSATALDNIAKLVDLKNAGALTDDEFQCEKRKILDGWAVTGPIKAATAYTQPFEIPLKPDTTLWWAFRPLNRYADFTTRSRAREFWFYSAVLLTVYAILFAGVVEGSVGINTSPTGAISVVTLVFVVLATLIPTTALVVRRFHDQNLSGWLALLNFIPYVGPLIVLAFMCPSGTVGPNRFGGDPKRESIV